MITTKLGDNNKLNALIVQNPVSPNHTFLYCKSWLIITPKARNTSSSLALKIVAKAEIIENDSEIGRWSKTTIHLSYVVLLVFLSRHRNDWSLFLIVSLLIVDLSSPSRICREIIIIIILQPDIILCPFSNVVASTGKFVCLKYLAMRWTLYFIEI